MPPRIEIDRAVSGDACLRADTDAGGGERSRFETAAADGERRRVSALSLVAKRGGSANVGMSGRGVAPPAAVRPELLTCCEPTLLERMFGFGDTPREEGAAPPLE